MEDEKLEQEHEQAEPFNDGADICQQLMERYAKSAAPQHRHLLATAAAMRSLLAAESLPLTPPAYFAAAISAIDDASSASQALDSTAVAALLAFLAIVLPLVPPRGIEAGKASEAVEVLMRLLAREKEGLAVSSVRAGVKCMGVLVGFCDLEDWVSVKLGFETLLKFSVDKRPKVRRCSQECLEKFFKSIHCSAVIKEASKLVISMLKTYIPLAVELSTSGASVGSKDDMSEPKNVEVLHMLNMLKLIVPFLSKKTRSKVLSEVDGLLKCEFSALTRHILKIIETSFETSGDDVIVPITENIVVSLSSYVSLWDKNPSDTVMSAIILLKRSLDILYAADSSSYLKRFSLVSDSVAGLLTAEASIASHAAITLKEIISNYVDQRSPLFDDNQKFLDEGKESIEASAIKSICAILENSLMACDGKPNEHILAVTSDLFLKLGGNSYYFMENIMLKLADFMILASGGKSNTCHLQSCIGSAVIAIGPERILANVPISLNAGDFSCSNTWLIPLLKKYVIGASLDYYMEHVMPLAKSFQRASRKVKETTIAQNLQAHAHDLWGLLSSFCRYPTDVCQNVGPLAKAIIKFLKKDSFMHENVAVALQVLVNQNKSTLNHQADAGLAKFCAVKESVLEFSNLPTYSKKSATKNLKAIASHSTELLQALTDLFIDSPPEKRSYLKDAVGCLASITDPSITKNIMMSLLEHFESVDDRDEFGKLENQENLSTMEKETQRCVTLELVSCLVEGAKEDLIDQIYNFIKASFQVTDEIVHRQAYHTLSRVLQEHTWFCSSRSVELIEFLLGFKSPTDTGTLRSRFACFHPLMVHILKMDSEDHNAKAFLVVNEIILTLKDAKEEEIRKAAYDLLLEISSSLRDTSSVSSESSDAPFQKLITMLMGYLSGASPHIKSGAVSVLSLLIYKDTDICFSMPDLIPSLLSLLQGKSIEVTKAVLGFAKVLVSCLEAKDLQHLLPDVVKEVLPWSSVSRHHFRSKVTIIMEIIMRKCGFSALELVTPEKYRRFIKSVLENRQTKTNSKDAALTDKETKHSTKSQGKRKHNGLDTVPEKIRSVKKDKNRTEKKQITNRIGTNEKPVKGQFERNRRFNKRKFDKGPPSGQKRKMNFGKKDGGVQKSATGARLAKRRKLGKR